MRISYLPSYYIYSYTILAVRKAGHFDIKTKIFDFEMRGLIGWRSQTRVFASQPIRTCASKSNIFVFMLRWPAFLTASILIVILQLVRAANPCPALGG